MVMRGVPDDDEVRPAMATSPCGSKWVLKNLSFGLIIYSQIWPLRTPPTEQWEEMGLVLTSYHLCVGGGGGMGEGRRGGGNKRSSQDYQDCREKPDNSHMVRQGFQLFCVWGRRHLSQDQFPAIQLLIYENICISQISRWTMHNW